MPVKIRCTGCKKILNVSDRARGKVIACPDCQTKIRVPTPKKKRAVAEKASLEESGFLGSLDLSNSEASDVRICPKCGSEIDDELTDVVDCPECGVNLETGLPGVAELAKRARKGVDPKVFYEKARADAKKFRRKNKHLVKQTFTIGMIFLLLCSASAYWSWYVTTLPPTVFFGFVALVLFLVVPGWTWHLHTEVIRATMEKKDSIKKVRLDIFQCMALGIKLFLWLTLFSLPMTMIAGLIGGGFYFMGFPVVTYVLQGLALLMVVPLFPIAMAHMSMPVTYRGWLTHKMFGAYWKNRGPALFWTMHLAISMIPSMLCLGGIAGVILADPGRPGLGLVEQVTAGVLGVLFLAAFSYASFFNMRTNGKLAFYFKKEIDLITLTKQVKYVSKEKKLAELSDEVASPLKTVALGLGAAFAVGAAVGVVIGSLGRDGPLSGLPKGLGVAGAVTTLVGIVLSAIGAFQKAGERWKKAKWGLAVLLGGLLYLGLAFLLRDMW